MDKAIRKRVQAGDYLVKSHAVHHALKEGFERRHIVEAILNARIIEEYPDEKRALVCGSTAIGDMRLYLHAVCEYADPIYLEIVTAYIPSEKQWEKPPFRRRKG